MRMSRHHDTKAVREVQTECKAREGSADLTSFLISIIRRSRPRAGAICVRADERKEQEFR